MTLAFSVGAKKDEVRDMRIMIKNQKSFYKEWEKQLTEDKA